MGKKGLEMVKTHPEVLPNDISNEILLKSMPLGAKEGDFTSNIVSNDNAFSGFVFKIPSETDRDNIASIVAVFDNASYNINNVRKIFSTLIGELKNNKAVSIDLLINILPTIYNAFGSKNMKIKISSVVTVQIDIENEDDTKESNGIKVAKSLADDMW
ncbi:MAG: hypothetical protein FK734_11155 [Asgard group archaeon]|nr:hypothetical protein [Asgard group archaeon]